MFLNMLSEEEKRAFLELAHHVARSDGDFSKDEKLVIETYCLEMQINDVVYKEEKFDFNQVISAFKSETSKKVLLLELMALIYSDDRIDDKEQEIINTIIQSFNISESIAKLYAEWTKSILSISAQGKYLLEI